MGLGRWGCGQQETRQHWGCREKRDTFRGRPDALVLRRPGHLAASFWISVSTFGKHALKLYLPSGIFQKDDMSKLPPQYLT